MELFIKSNENDCPQCGSNSSIELFDVYNNKINYSLLLDKYRKGDNINNTLDHIELSYFKCTKCGKKYVIDWREDHFPKPFIILKER